MKILFLDVDGVLNSKETVVRQYKKTGKGTVIGIDPYLSILVHRIKENTGCEIVLSSSWRHHPESVREIEQIFGKLRGLTPTKGSVRGDEIKAWLDDNPEVENYAILDDDDDMLEEQLPHFFKTSWDTGITEEIAEAVEDYLGKR